MYSPTQQEFFESEQFAHTGLTPHTTVGAVPVSRNRFSNYHYHQRTGSFGAAMSPPNAATMAAAAAAASGGRFADPNAQNWFGTSVDSTGSSFGQSPIFNHIVSPSTSTSHLDNIASAEDEEAQQRNFQEMFEKRRRRRESHNAVERRRRDNINERIYELSTLLPEHLLEKAPTTSNVMSVNSQAAAGGAGGNAKAINKGTILKLSVDYIREMQEQVSQYKERMQKLEQLIEAANRGEKIPEDELNAAGTAAGASAINASDKEHPVRHERVGSFQFQQQFGNLHIEDPK